MRTEKEIRDQISYAKSKLNDSKVWGGDVSAYENIIEHLQWVLGEIESLDG